MKKIIYILSAAAVILLLAAGAYAYFLYDEAQETVDEEMHAELERENTEQREMDVEVDADEPDPASFLLLGLDAEDTADGLADAIIVVTIHPEEDTMKMLSLPRDTMVEIPGYGEDKINHAYGFGGADLIVETVENYLDIPLDHYISINMDGFEEMVDAIDGVTVENEFAFETNDYSFEEGEIELDGERALAYARMRDEDDRGDIGRNDRQRQIINAMIEEGAELSSLANAPELMSAFGSHVNTSLDFNKITAIQQDYASARYNQTVLEFDIDLNEDGEIIDNIWYLQVPEEERQRVSDAFRTHLELDTNESGSSS